MTLRLGPPYLDEPRAKVPPPGWHRLPSTAWLSADILLTGLFVALLGMDGHAIWVLVVGLIAFVAAAVSVVTSIVEIRRHRKPVVSTVNLILSLAVNPYMVAGYLVKLGILDFG